MIDNHDEEKGRKRLGEKDASEGLWSSGIQMDFASSTRHSRGERGGNSR